ncbi:MAG: hypothetical protein HFG04_09875 [Oscillibacter sp.]|jgi:hypothetical protein|nr:hypothetical protein [Oscillibacter sp.]
MGVTQVNYPPPPRQAQTPSASQEKRDRSPDIYEMMRDAREKADATREKFKGLKGNPRYGDAPMEAYARLARAKRPSEVTAAAGFARRQIARLKAAKRTDPDNAKRIQATINQLQKAVTRAGKKSRELDRERLDKARQEKLAQEKKSREAQRQRLELRRKQAARIIRESGYIREAEIDNRMQAQLSATRMELQKQAQDLAASLQPSPEAVARQYASGSAPVPEVPAGGEIDLQA